MSEELVVSTPEQVGRSTRVIALPVAQNGVTIVLKIGACYVPSLIGPMGGLPGVNGVVVGSGEKRPFTEVAPEIERAAPSLSQIAELGIVEPAFSFGEQREDGKAWWRDLVQENQAFVVREVLSLSGLGEEAAGKAGTFPQGDPGQGTGS